MVGFGGYPTVPPLLAASWRNIPTVLHEQNGVMGRANAFLAPRVTAIATGFRRASRISIGTCRARYVHRQPGAACRCIAAGQIPYAAPADGKLNLLVFGGSQGARVMSEIVPAAVGQLDAESAARGLTSCSRRAPRISTRCAATYAQLGVAAEVAPFFVDLPARIAAAHLVVSRSGASTVAELAAIGRPPFWCRCRTRSTRTRSPMPGCWRTPAARSASQQPDFTPERLARRNHGAVE